MEKFATVVGAFALVAIIYRLMFVVLNWALGTFGYHLSGVQFAAVLAVVRVIRFMFRN
jgi:hypothetical protein